MMATLSQQTDPDDAPCLKCTDIVNKDSKALQCDLCRQWVHISCANVGVKAYSTLQSLNGSMWLCESCQEELPNIPKELAAFKEENKVLRLQLRELSDLPSIVKSMQLKLETLSEELDSIKRGNDGMVTVQRKRKRNHSSPLPGKSLGLNNRFAPLASQGVSGPADAPIPMSIPSPLGIEASDEATPSQTNTSELNRTELFYLRAIPRSTKLAEIRQRLTSFGVSTSTLSYPPILSTNSHRIYMTLSLSVDEANKLSSALREDTSQCWFLSVLPPRAPRPSLNSIDRTHQSQSCQVPYPRELGPPVNCGPSQGPPQPPNSTQVHAPIPTPHTIPHQAHTPNHVAGPPTWSKAPYHGPQPPTFAQVLIRGTTRPRNPPNLPQPRVPQPYNPTNLPSASHGGNFRPVIPPLMSLRLAHGMYGDGA